MSAIAALRGRNPMAKKIVYLFGAGATHAELAAIDGKIEEQNRGLLIGNVSRRVMDAAKAQPSYFRGIESVASATGAPNIELLISLIENSKVPRWHNRTAVLRQLVERDIKSILTVPRLSRFYLHRGLLSLHEKEKVRVQEEILGLISLNYDDVLDRAYFDVFGEKPNYCFTVGDTHDGLPPLLKLHGSFNWRQVRILGRCRDVDIIPLGSSKTYIHSPYGAIWNRALYLLSRCDALRVIGCSLSPNDLHLIDLLFKAQLERDRRFDIEIIADAETTGEAVRRNYGFFGDSIKLLTDIGVSKSVGDPDNPFRTWLKERSDRLMGVDAMKKDPYLKKLLN